MNIACKFPLYKPNVKSSINIPIIVSLIVVILLSLFSLKYFFRSDQNFNEILRTAVVYILLSTMAIVVLLIILRIIRNKNLVDNKIGEILIGKKLIKITINNIEETYKLDEISALTINYFNFSNNLYLKSVSIFSSKDNNIEFDHNGVHHKYWFSLVSLYELVFLERLIHYWKRNKIKFKYMKHNKVSMAS